MLNFRKFLENFSKSEKTACTFSSKNSVRVYNITYKFFEYHPIFTSFSQIILLFLANPLLHCECVPCTPIKNQTPKWYTTRIIGHYVTLDEGCGECITSDICCFKLVQFFPVGVVEVFAFLFSELFVKICVSQAALLP